MYLIFENLLYNYFMKIIDTNSHKENLFQRIDIPRNKFKIVITYI